MRHEVLFLNGGRSYVRLDDVWYDTNKEHDPQVGQGFLMGRVEEVLDFETYKETYPESKMEMFYNITDKTQTRGFIRKVSDLKYDTGNYSRMVEYAVNPAQPTVLLKQDIDLN